MGAGKKLRSWCEKRRSQQQPSPVSHPSAASRPAASSTAASVVASPTNAQASTPSTPLAPVAASGAASQTPSRRQPIQPPAPRASDLFPFMYLAEHPDVAKKTTAPRRVYVSLSADLRLIYADRKSSKPSSLLDFRHADCRLALTRLLYEPPHASSPPLSLEDVVAPRVCPATHPAALSVRITDRKRSILLIAATEDERDAFLSALRLRVAPWPILREQMEAEMRTASVRSLAAPSLADIARGFVSDAASAAAPSPGSTSDAGENGVAGLAMLVWDRAGTVAQASLWAATFGQGLGAVVHTANELEKLAKPLGGLTVVGCAFSLVALSARAVSLMALEREGRNKLAKARADLRDSSISLVFDVLGECWDGADELEQYLMQSLPMRAWNAEDIGSIVSKVESLSDKIFSACLVKVVAVQGCQIADNTRAIQGLQGQALVKDDFCPYAPDSLDFSVGLVESAATSLARLKGAVLPIASTERGVDDSRVSHSGLGVRRVSLASINGEGGVGKTSTCRLLCADNDVQRRFSDGAIVWIDVGQGATEDKVKNELRSAVLLCGGERSSGAICLSLTVKAAVEIARKFFLKRLVLVVIDNVWDTPADCSVSSWTAALSRIASFSGSAVLITTRSTLLSKTPGFDRVPLGRLDLTVVGSPDWKIAETMFDTLLGASPEMKSTDIYKQDRATVLDMSCGLPLAIRTFVGVVHNRFEIGDDVRSVLTKIKKRAIGLTSKYVGDDLKTVIGHPGLFAAMEESLEFLDRQKGLGVVSTPLPERKYTNGKDGRLFRASYDCFSGLSLSSRYAALSMLPASSTRLSFPVLCRLWHLRSVEETEEVALLFVNIGLGRIEGIRFGQEKVFCLHDLQYSYCVDMRVASASATTGVHALGVGSVNGHALLLSSCESLLDSEDEHDDVGAGWVHFCFGEGLDLSEPLLRRYLAQSLFRHICAAAAAVNADGVRKTVCNVLTNFCWLRGRIVGDGRAYVLSDFATALAARACTSANSSEDVRLLTGSAEKSIRALQQNLMLVGESSLKEADGMLAGSLIQLSQSSVGSGDHGMDAHFRSKLVYSSEREVRGAWVKPVCGCSPKVSTQARDLGVLVQAVIGSGGWVRALTALGDGKHFVSGSDDGAVRVHETEYLGSVLSLEGHTDVVTCVDVAKEGADGSFLIVSGGFDEHVRSWEVGLDPANGVIENANTVVGDCGSSVQCVSVSNGGELVAAGCESGIVFIWKLKGGSATIVFELVTSFRCAAEEKDSGWVNGVAVSRSGDFVVAAESKGTVAFWSSGESGHLEMNVDRICVFNQSGANLRHVLLSKDESSVSIVTTSFKRPAVYEVWDIASRTRRSTRVVLCGFEFLTCVAFSSGEEACVRGSRSLDDLVVGGWDKTYSSSSRGSISIFATGDESRVRSTFSLAASPRSVCSTCFSGYQRILVGSDDGCVRMLDASGDLHLANEAREACTTVGDSDMEAYSSYVSELDKVFAIAVLPTVGHVLAGHNDGRFSLWRAESGEFLRAFAEDRGNGVFCADACADESLAMSGHRNGVALVWETSTWECRFALDGHSGDAICATFSADAKRIVTVDERGELRLWDSENGGAALWAIETGPTCSYFWSRAAISLDGGLFLWASRNGDQRWRGKLIDLGNRKVILQSEEARHFYWDAFVKEMTSGVLFGGEDEVGWKFGAVFWNRLVELRDADSDQQSVNVLRVSSGAGPGNFLPRVNCALQSKEGGAPPVVSAAASLDLDIDVMSLAAGWIPRENGYPRHAVVACMLRGRSCPAIMHFIPADIES